MSIDVRLNKLMPGLSAKERAILVLRSLREKTPEDPLWRRTMPQEQPAEFRRLMVLVNACNIYCPSTSRCWSSSPSVCTPSTSGG